MKNKNTVRNLVAAAKGGLDCLDEVERAIKNLATAIKNLATLRSNIERQTIRLENAIDDFYEIEEEPDERSPGVGGKI